MRKTISDAKQSATTASSGNSAASGTSSLGSASRRHYVYIVECSDGSLYTGYSTNPSRRLAEHNCGGAARYTRTRRPVRLVFLEELASRGEALGRELRIKRMKKEEKLLLCRAYAGLEKPRSR